MKYSLLLCIVLICYCILMCPLTGYSFDDHYTHKDLSREAISNSKLRDYLESELDNLDIFDELIIHANEKLNNGKNISNWIQNGSYQEDNPDCRAANHFHNPLLPWNESMLTDEMFLAELKCFFYPYGEKNSNIVWATGYKSGSEKKNPPVNNDPQKNDGRNWDVAREYFYQALQDSSSEKREEYLAQTFNTIGYLLHLLQDMASPAHVRNDLSSGHDRWVDCPLIDEDKRDCKDVHWTDVFGNPFEGYVRDHFDYIRNNISELSRPFSGEPVLTNFWDTNDADTHLSVPTNFDGLDLGLAEYTNLNFLSYNTIFKSSSDEKHYFRYPSRESIIDKKFPDKISWEIYKDIRKTYEESGDLDTGIYITKEAGEGHRIEKFLSLRYALYGADEPENRYDLRFKLDEECFLEYAKHLIPRAIGYSAGLIDYFFRGKLEVEFVPGEVMIYNRSEETMSSGTYYNLAGVEMDGAFELYYENKDGQRKLLNKTTLAGELQPGASQVITFTMPGDFNLSDEEAKLITVFRGKLGAEDGAIAAKIIEVGPVYVVIKVGDNTGTQFFTVWDAKNNTVANISNPKTKAPITFPARYEEMADWLSDHSATTASPAYKWDVESDGVLSRIGETWQDFEDYDCTADSTNDYYCENNLELPMFNHPGCGEFQSTSNYVQKRTIENGKEIWDTSIDATVHVDSVVRNSLLGSFAPRVNTRINTDQAACFRSEWHQEQSVKSYVPAGSFWPINEYKLKQPITWTTPLGTMDFSQSREGDESFYSYIECPVVREWTMWHRDPPYNGVPIAKPIIYAGYSDNLMVQLYMVSMVNWTGKQKKDFMGDDDQCVESYLEENYSIDNRIIAGCTVVPGKASLLDPRAQEKNSAFQDAILHLVDHTITMQKSAGEITDKEVFKGGINIYFAKKVQPAMEGLLKLINDDRALSGLYPLLPNNDLNTAAKSHAEEMASKESLSSGSDDSIIRARIQKTGYMNVVLQGSSSSYSEYILIEKKTGEEFFNVLKEDDNWNALMNAGFREIGLGSALSKDGVRYWSLIFGRNSEH